MSYRNQRYPIRCQDCGQRGHLDVTTHAHDAAWSFVSVGFIGLAVNRYHPQLSIMRCNQCWSSDVRILGPEPDAEKASDGG